MFEKAERVHYGNNQLVEVICQLRFPTILHIGVEEPAEFQEAIRGMFPRYSVRQDALPPKINGAGTPAVTVEPQKPVTNYHFLSADNQWQLNLTNSFLALTCHCYDCWEGFARKMDQPLAHLIRIYQPAFFERIGLRYLNAFSRNALGLEDRPWRELIREPYAGILSGDDVPEKAVRRCTHDVDMQLPRGCRLKLHSGLGQLTRNGHEDPETRWILDLDLWMGGTIPVNQSAPALQTLHSQAGPVFRSVLTDTLEDALEPDEQNRQQRS